MTQVTSHDPYERLIQALQMLNAPSDCLADARALQARLAELGEMVATWEAKVAGPLRTERDDARSDAKWLAMDKVTALKNERAALEMATLAESRLQVARGALLSLRDDTEASEFGDVYRIADAALAAIRDGKEPSDGK